MSAINRYSYAGDTRLKIRQSHDFSGLIDHFQLLLGVAIVEENIDMREHIERNLVRVNFTGDVLAGSDLTNLTFQLNNTHCARSGYCLIG